MAGEVLGIDVGGSSVKAGLVDVQRGTVTGTLSSAPTPRPCTPASLMPVLDSSAAGVASAGVAAFAASACALRIAATAQ